MSSLLKLAGAHAALGRLLDHFRSLLCWATRFYVGWQFWKSGWLKITTCKDQTLDLFRNEYHVSAAPRELAAVTGNRSANCSSPLCCSRGCWAASAHWGPLQ